MSRKHLKELKTNFNAKEHYMRQLKLSKIKKKEQFVEASRSDELIKYEGRLSFIHLLVI